MKIENGEFNSTEVELDNNEFINCKFEDCIVIYRAKGPVTLVNNDFKNVRWEFRDAAGLTLQFLGAIYTGLGEGGKQLVENICKDLARAKE